MASMKTIWVAVLLADVSRRIMCLAIYSRTVNSETPLNEVLKTRYPWVRHMGGRS
jgi:hypothetical protein